MPKLNCFYELQKKQNIGILAHFQLLLTLPVKILYAEIGTCFIRPPVSKIQSRQKTSPRPDLCDK